MEGQFWAETPVPNVLRAKLLFPAVSLLFSSASMSQLWFNAKIKGVKSSKQMASDTLHAVLVHNFINGTFAYYESEPTL